ncbi:MAG: shikimate kinase [Alphaproteobacteria bacterium]
MSETKDAESHIEIPGLDRTIVLVGLMGAGKTTIGRKLAARLGMRFVDADEEIERAAGLSVKDIFAKYGEAEFRSGERRVIARLLQEPPLVLATGGGAFMDTETRTQILAHAISVWLKADLDLLERRVARRNTRPLLNTGNPREILARLMAERYPVYAEANVAVEARDQPQSAMVQAIIEALTKFCARGGKHSA